MYECLRHSWKQSGIEADGAFRKENWPPGFYRVTDGLLELCVHCPMMRLVPSSKDLRASEVSQLLWGSVPLSIQLRVESLGTHSPLADSRRPLRDLPVNAVRNLGTDNSRS